MLEKNVGHSNLELPELGHLSNDLAGDEMAPSRRGGDGDRPLGPGGLPGHDLQKITSGRHAAFVACHEHVCTAVKQHYVVVVAIARLLAIDDS